MRFDTDAELDLAVRTSSVPLRIMVQNSRSRSAASTGRNPQAAAAASSSPIPSTPGYAVASNVGSVLGEDDTDMIMVEAPGGDTFTSVGPAGNAGGGGSNDGGGSAAGGNALDGNQADKSKEEIDAPAAFEAEAAAARDPEGSVLYQKASIRLTKRFQVHLTPTQLWRVMALFQIQGRQLVIFGLAPQRALDTAADPSFASGASSDEEAGGAAARAGGLKRSKDHVARGLVADPVQRLLSLNGVDLPEEEVQPLLGALRVRPRRLVRLNLLPPDVLEEMPDEHREGRGLRGGPDGRHMHGHGHGGRFSVGRPGVGRGRGGGRGGPPTPFHPPPPFHNQQHQGGAFSGPHGGLEDGNPPHHGPPPHVMGMGPPHMEPPQGHHHRGHHPRAPHMGGEGHHHHHPMWQPYPGGYGGPPGPTGGGYAYGYGYGGPGGGDWHEWAGPYGGGGGRGGGGRGGGGGGPECRGAKRGFGKGTKDNMAMARFVSHTSGSDLAKVVAGQTFKKSWLVRNDSTTTWPETCSLIPVSQSCADLSPPPEAPIVGDVAPGEEITVSVDLIAPHQPGMYEGYWRARDSSARKFGQRLWAKVMVVAPGQDVSAAVERLSLDDNGNKDN